MPKSFPGGSAAPTNAGEVGTIPGFGRFPLEKKMATHSNIFAWEIPWTEGPGRLQSMGSQRVGYQDLMTIQQAQQRYQNLETSFSSIFLVFILF